MRKLSIDVLAGLGLVVGAVAFTAQAVGQDAAVQSLRGDTELSESSDAPEVLKQNVERRFERGFRQQPPLIPHKVEKYQVNLKVNQCLRCHDWPYNVQENAPKISETHYTNRNGAALDKVATSRWFCTQCHVPQMFVRALVPNTFKSAFELD